MGKMDEQILVVNRDWLFDEESTTFQGITTDDKLVKRLMVKLNNTYEARRGDAEDNPNWKQPIPYCVIKRGNEVFLYERLKSGGEARLHNQLSIGVGGHMNNMDDLGDWRSNLIRNLIRELNEELYLDFTQLSPPRVTGFINDDSNEVGKCHIGVLVIMELPEDSEVVVKEVDQLDGYWVRIRDIKKPPLYDQLENWSKLAVEML